MDEIMETMETEVTTPEEPVTDPAGEQPEESPVEPVAEDLQEDTTPNEDPVTEETTPAPVMVPVKFRHEQRDLTMEEATRYAQLGLLREAEQPMLETLALMAAGRGQSVQEYVAALSASEEKFLLKEKLEITNGNEEEAQKLLQYDLDARRAACADRVRQEQEAEQQAEQTLTERLAAEFVELQQEYADIGEFSTIPQEVVNDAIRNKRHLLDAYLRYQHREGKKIEQNRAAQAAAAAASTGSMYTVPNQPEDAATAAMLKGLRSVF